MSSSCKLIEEELISRKIEYSLIVLPIHMMSNILYRIQKGLEHLNMIEEFINSKIPQKISPDSIFIFSCGEGFEISNIDIWFKPYIRKGKYIAIQHGMFGLQTINNKSYIKIIINKMSRFILNYSLVGKGFGGTFFDNYIVYSEKYENYLTSKKGWKKDNIIISGALLKGGKKVSSGTKQITYSTCLLLLQDLVITNYVTKKYFMEYFQVIVDQLCVTYNSVIIKYHPKMNPSDYRIKNNDRIIYSKGNLMDDIQRSEVAFSFFSTAMIDANIADVPVIGIIIPGINIEKYNFLKKSINYDQLTKEIKRMPNYDDCIISEDEIDLTDNIETSINKMLL